MKDINIKSSDSQEKLKEEQATTSVEGLMQSCQMSVSKERAKQCLEKAKGKKEITVMMIDLGISAPLAEVIYEEEGSLENVMKNWKDCCEDCG